MASGGIVSRPTRQYNGRVTFFVLFTCIVGATGGLIFGYDIGISGGVTSMDMFLKRFFPTVYHKESSAKGQESAYCKFNSHLLQMFTSSLYLAALAASCFASAVTKVYGRKMSMFAGGLTFLIGSIFNGLAQNIGMLIIGRVFLGIGVGFCNQSVPVYISEMAPANIRGALNIGFQMAISIGILTANLINYGASRIKGNLGWRLSLGLASVPATVVTLGIFLPDSPNSLINRGLRQEARTMLQKIRGTENVDEEYQDLVEASEASKPVDNAWRNIFQRRNRPQLIMAILIPSFQQLTGINVIMFYAPVLFKTLGVGDNAALMSAAITGGVNVLATTTSIFFVDRIGRRALFLEGGLQMFICQILTALFIGKTYGTSGVGQFTQSSANFVLFLICTYVAAFAWSWGPLGWLVPSEIFPLETRSAGQAIAVIFNMAFTFIIAQFFLTMLCDMKYGLFLFFSAFVVMMTIFIYFFLPETKGVPIEEMYVVWKKHWFWGKYIPDEALGSYAHKNNVEMSESC